MTDAEPTILLRAEGSVRHLTFNRPARRNAITFEMMQALETAFRNVAADPAARVLVLRGAGGQFCAGGDLGHMLDPPGEDSADPVASAYRRMGAALRALQEMPQAVVAVVEGACVGGGLGMASVADYVISTANAKFGMPEARAGFIPSQILPAVVRRIGPGQALRLAVVARVIDGAEAQRIGVVHELVDDSEAADAALNRALEDLAWAEPGAVKEIKRLIGRLASGGDESDVLDDAAASLSRLLRSPEAAEGIAAFKSKRRPAWSRSETPE